MGREIKRVPVGFDWPLKQRWQGFLNPHSPRQCSGCGGMGYSAAAKLYQDEWYGNAEFDPRSTGSEPFGWAHPLVREFATFNVLYDFDTRTMQEQFRHHERAIRREAERLAGMWDAMWMHHLSQADVDALVEADRLRDLTHNWTRENGWQPKEPPCRPTAKEVNEWSIRRGLGHDSINCWVCVKARCARDGEPYTCAACEGHGYDPADKATHDLMEAWTRTHPPEGDGWQLWETTTEGSPITPAFATAEELARWCADHQFNGPPMASRRRWNYLVGGEEELTYEQWLAFIGGPGWAPSMVSGPGGVSSGVAAVIES